MRAFLVLGAVVVATAGGCGGRGSASEPTARASSPIQGGTDDTTHDFTVGIQIDLGGGNGLICSGILLAPNLVATARHCAQQPSSDTVICGQTTFGNMFSANGYLVTTSPVMQFGDTRYMVDKIIVPTGADENYVCGNDIALLILSKNVTLPQYVQPVLSPPMTNHAVWATTETAIGYGVDAPGAEAGATAGTRRIRENVAFECIPDDPAFVDCYADPAKKSAIAPDEFWSGDGVCEGDSGGGAFDQTQFDAGNWVAFGVAVRGGVSSDGTTCLGSIYTRFDAWPDLLVSAATEASQLGGYPLPSWVANAAADDAGFPQADPSVGPGGVVPGSGAPASSKGGCAAATPDGPTPSAPWRTSALAALLMGLAALGRRRRPSRKTRRAGDS
jgi:MYXO-CTERM domain-containing protein